MWRGPPPSPYFACGTRARDTLTCVSLASSGAPPPPPRARVLRRRAAAASLFSTPPRPPPLRLRVAFRQQCGDAAERSADHRRPQARSLRQRVGHGARVGGEIGKRIGPLRNPRGIAVPALVDRIGDAARPGDALGGRAP